MLTLEDWPVKNDLSFVSRPQPGSSGFQAGNNGNTWDRIGVYNSQVFHSIPSGAIHPILATLFARRAYLLLVPFIFSGCVQREGRNSDCQWPPTQPGANQGALRADLEFAEELAIRYMEAHFGPRDLEAAAQAKNRCMGSLLAEIGKKHGMTAQEAFRSFGQRSAAVDFAMNLPFLLVYVVSADFAIRRLLGRYPPSDGWTTTIIMMLLASGAFGAGGLILGQQWSGVAESIRVGTTHLSNRSFRLPLSKHPSETFMLAAALFLGMAVLRYWTRRTNPVLG